MIKLIIGNKGSGKTKTMIRMANEAVETSKGYVVCVEKGLKLTYDLKNSVRLIDTEEYDITGYDCFYAFLSGILAGNYDITEVFVDSILKIGGRDLTALEKLLFKIDAKFKDTEFVFTVSADYSEIPGRLTTELSCLFAHLYPFLLNG